MGLAEFLNIQTGITAFIGGGGKTTLLRTLGEELAQKHSVLLCTTTKIFPFPNIPWTNSLEDLMEWKERYSLLCTGTPDQETGKLLAPQVPFSVLKKAFEYILVEADGAARRPLKAHALHEPVIPEMTDQVVCVVGISGFGKPIKDAVHRPELYTKIASADMVMPVTVQMEAAVLLAEKLHDRVFVNQVETDIDIERAKELAKLLDCPVVAGSLHRREYIVCSY